MENNINSLKEWHKLLEDGIISEHEYEAKKREILGLPQSSLKIDEQESASNVVKTEEPVSQINPQPQIPTNSSAKRSVPRKSSGLNANQIFLIVVGVLLLIGGGFWFWNNNESKGEDKLSKTNKFEDSVQATKMTTELHSEDNNNASLDQKLSKDFIISSLIEYEKNNFLSKLKEDPIYSDDKKYIVDLTSNSEIEESGSTNVTFTPAYQGYNAQWKSENDWKIGKCISSYTIQLDQKRITEDNLYEKTTFTNIDLNGDGKNDVLVDGYFTDCSGGSGSEAHYFLTFINNGKNFKLTDILLTAPLEHRILNNRIIVEGLYKSLSSKTVYDFDDSMNKWIEKDNKSN